MASEVVADKNEGILRLRREDWWLIFGVVAVLPLMVLQSQNLSERKHLQFFPVAWLCFGFLAYSRLALADSTSVWRVRLGNFSMFLATSIAAFAVVRFSPWLAHVASVVLIFGWLLIRAGKNAWTEVVSWTAVLLITLPLPNNLDSLFIQRLQYISTNSASLLLDLISVPHVARGNVLEIRTGELFVDEACSGIDSFYSLAAIALVLVVWNRSSLAIALATLATIPLWAWLGNLIRIFLIAFLLDGYEINWSEGWPHTLLGLAVFSVSAISLLLTYEVSKCFLTQVPAGTMTKNLLHRSFNRVVLWPALSSSAKKPRKSEVVPNPVKNELPIFFVTPICIGCCLVGLGSLLPLNGIGPWDTSRYTLPSWTTQQVETAFRENDLPESFMGLTRRTFSVIHRDTGSIYGEHSATWLFHDHTGQEVQISCDFPFPGFHGLEQCYTAAGQDVSQPIRATASDTIAGSATIYTVSLQDKLLQSSVLLYTNFDSLGNDIAKPKRTILGPALERPPIAYQAQVFLPQCDGLSADREELFAKILLQSSSVFIDRLKTLKDMQK